MEITPNGGARTRVNLTGNRHFVKEENVGTGVVTEVHVHDLGMRLSQPGVWPIDLTLRCENDEERKAISSEVIDRMAEWEIDCGPGFRFSTITLQKKTKAANENSNYKRPRHSP